MGAHQHPHLPLLSSRAAYLLCNSTWEGKVGWGGGFASHPVQGPVSIPPCLLGPLLLPDGERL